MSPSEVTRSLKVGRSPNQVVVEHRDDKVVVIWAETSCSTRSFTLDQMREVILLIDGLLTRVPDMWLEFGTEHYPGVGGTFYLNLNKDGKLTGTQVLKQDNKRVAWTTLKKALEEIVGHVESELGEHKTSSTQEAKASATKKGSR